jgi:uncharacterized protein YndB with AHSA1/START domain
MNDKIEKEIEIDAPVARVWRALTDHREFGDWFGLVLETPFKLGKAMTGRFTFKGMEDRTLSLTTVAVVPQTHFAFSWHPYAMDPAVDYSSETPTLVEFKLEPKPSGGTKLRVTESGFDKVPAHRRAEAFRMNTGGWSAQLANIKAYAEKHG